ncbi:hypothetical protein OH77DRAFT_899749 [Trametes cingulata]|nr:hypothetical protein OH77DRAFT_899749 [Trametes cingulata]
MPGAYVVCGRRFGAALAALPAGSFYHELRLRPQRSTDCQVLVAPSTLVCPGPHMHPSMIALSMPVTSQLTRTPPPYILYHILHSPVPFSAFPSLRCRSVRFRPRSASSMVLRSLVPDHHPMQHPCRAFHLSILFALSVENYLTPSHLCYYYSLLSRFRLTTTRILRVRTPRASPAHKRRASTRPGSLTLYQFPL